MRIVSLPAGGPHPTAPLVVEGGFAAVQGGGALRVFDIRGTEPDAVLDLPDILASATSRRMVVTLDAKGTVARWERRDERWLSTMRLELPSAPEDAELVASPSGRFAFVDGKRGMLVDLEGERIVTELDAPYGTARPCFDRLPDGREILFVAAPGYMSVLMIDALRGDMLGKYEEQASTDFCHVDFRLALDGSRLVTFGCVWACPYEARIYDATPWTKRGSAPELAASGFSLPLVRSIEPFASNTLLAAHVDEAAGELTSACLEDRADLLPDEE